MSLPYNERLVRPIELEEEISRIFKSKRILVERDTVRITRNIMFLLLTVLFFRDCGMFWNETSSMHEFEGSSSILLYLAFSIVF
jgi:hypothetical protein